MWPVKELRALLPEHLYAEEDSDVGRLRCLCCGWTATFSVAGVTREAIVAEAQRHRCSGKADMPPVGEAA